MLWRSLAALATLVVAWLLGNGAHMLWREDQAHDRPASGRGRWVTADDVQIHVTEQGPVDGPRLVLVAGTGAWGGTWASNAPPVLAAGWRVVTIDLPPFGFSSRPADHNYSRHVQAQRLIAAIRSLSGAPVVLLGHSYGGGPAAEAAMLEPALVHHLILVDAAIGLRSTSDAACAAGSQAIWPLAWRPLRSLVVANTATQPLLTENLLRRFVARKDAVTPQRAAIYAVPNRVRGTSAAIGDWAYQFATSCESARSQSAAGFAALRMPMTLLWGEQDTITPPAQARAIAAAKPGSRLVMLPGVGHIPQIEDPALFNRELGAVLAGLR